MSQVKDEMSFFAKTVMDQKYAHDLPSGGKEDWPSISRRVVTAVFKAVGAPKTLVEQTVEKMLYNATRVDHTHAARLAPNGKKF